ncbi:MAG: hydroxymyristoyl-ACP dehydratase [Bacteroidales bacterium]|jgi:predicted hotdog family 3-hydroxylacyl-ACP dehydratase
MGVFEKALITGEGILQYIPQRPPMVMVDTYYGRVDDASYTGYTPTESSLFCEGGFFQETGIIEHIAQSAAVCAGVEFIDNGKEVPVGYIGAVSKFKVFRLPSVGKSLHTTTREVQKFMDVSLVCSEVELDGEVIATGELKIFLQNSTETNQ